MRQAIAGVALLLLGGCAGASHSCVVVKEMTPREQSALADALGKISTDSPIVTAMGDYKRMRDEARVCQLIAQ